MITMLDGTDLFGYRGATLSRCGGYRYTLWRIWDESLPAVMFIGLNPSTADAEEDDPTIRRMIGFARRWHYGRIMVGNLFAWRSTDPAGLSAAEDPVGCYNDHALMAMAEKAAVVVAAWGVGGFRQGRDKQVRDLLPDLYHLGLTKDGYPRHPLYVPGDRQLTHWER